MNKLKGLLIYSFSGFFGAGINFLVLPILTFYLTPAEYGVLSLFNTYVTILIPLIGVLASGLINVEYFKIKDKEEFASLFSSVQLVPVIPFVLCSLTFILFQSTITDYAELSDLSLSWLLLIPLLSLLTIYIETLLNYLVVKNNSRRYAVLNITRTIIEVLLTLLFVIYFKMGWKGRILSWLITSIIYFAISVIYFWQSELFTLNVRWVFIKESVYFGAPLILHTIGKFVMNQSDRLFIAKFISVEEAGIYNMGYQIGMIMLIVINAFGNFFTPYLYERLEANTYNGKIEILRMSYMAFFAMVLLLATLSISSPYIFSILIDSRYARSTDYVFWTGLGYLFWGIYIIFSGFVYFFKKTKIYIYLSIFSVVLNIVLNYVLIKRFGGIGAAYATCISFLGVAVFIGIYVKTIISMPWFSFHHILSLEQNSIANLSSFFKRFKKPNVNDRF